MIVLDASAMVDFLIDRPGVAEQMIQAVEDDGSELLHVPELVQLEAIQTIRGLVRGGSLAEEDARSAIEELPALRLVFHAAAPLIDRIWELRHNLSAYDASYLALAETLTEPLLVTCDGGLAEQARRVLGTSHVRLLA